MSTLPWERWPDDEGNAGSEPPFTQIEEPSAPGLGKEVPDTQVIPGYEPPTDQGLPPTEVELPYVPPSGQVSPTDLASEITAVVQETLRDALPSIQQQAKDYALQSVRAAVQGTEIDHAHPTVIATTATGKELVVADAKSRSARTLFQGLTIDIIAALAAVAATLSGLDPFDKATWIIVAYFMRLKVTPTVKVPETEQPAQRVALLPTAVPVESRREGRELEQGSG
jgi:hypothetical protein